MADSFINVDEDPVADKRLATDQRTIGGQLVEVPLQIITDGSTAGRKLTVNADGSIPVAPAAGTSQDVKSKGATIADAAAVSVTTAATAVAAANPARRVLWLYNASTQDVWIGTQASVAVNRGVRIPPKATAVFSGAPAAAFYGRVAAGTADVIPFEERD